MIDKLEEVLESWLSDNAKKKYFTVSSSHTKLCKKMKDNEFVRIRDNITIGLKMVVNSINYIPHVTTSENGRKDLYRLKDDIIKAFKEIGGE